MRSEEMSSKAYENNHRLSRGGTAMNSGFFLTDADRDIMEPPARQKYRVICAIFLAVFFLSPINRASSQDREADRRGQEGGQIGLVHVDQRDRVQTATK